ncbi:hypothetical protein [Mycobacterium europaeum]|uniref:hypothetical protein n=1 Tax=Mycobacterium europaeum TaxID=761804 RepID=UPI00114693C7|nr:hypothetical protein [Mycobacterium europaeum]
MPVEVGLVVATMGANVAGGTAFVALVENSQLLDTPPYALAPSEVHGAVASLSKFEEDVSRQLNLWNVQKLVVLEPETTYRAPYSGFVDRIGVESVLLLSAHRSGIPTFRISRQKVRSLLGLGRQLKFEVLAAERLTPVGPHWKNKRDCAALAALAGEME